VIGRVGPPRRKWVPDCLNRLKHLNTRREEATLGCSKLLDEKTTSHMEAGYFPPSGHGSALPVMNVSGTRRRLTRLEVSIRKPKRPKIPTRRPIWRFNCGACRGIPTHDRKTQFQGGIGCGPLPQLMGRWAAITLKDGPRRTKNLSIGYTAGPTSLNATGHVVCASGSEHWKAPHRLAASPRVPLSPSPAVVNALAKLTGKKRYRSLAAY
jgi:hypothetical protein